MKLFYFTESFPYGLGESWKLNEIKYLSGFFDEIIVIPLWDGNVPNPLKLSIDNVKILDPTLTNPNCILEFKDLKYLFNFRVIKEVFRSNAWFKKSRIIKILLFAKRVSQLLNSKNFKHLLSVTGNDTVWYFFWGRGWADLIAFKNNFDKQKTVVRVHGYDLYMERNEGYIPFRDSLFKSVDSIITVSQTGMDYLIRRNAGLKSKIRVLRLGVRFFGKSNSSSDGIFRIVSCSGLVPVKRLDRIINALKDIDSIPIQWTHIGDGPLRGRLEEMIESLPSNIQVVFVGKLSAHNVARFYLDNPVDVLVNTSESEGVPVAVMEAFSFGIPVIASNVGGTKEIVDDSVGFLLEEDNIKNSLSDKIRKIYSMNKNERQKLSDGAFLRFKLICDNDFWVKELRDHLIS